MKSTVSGAQHAVRALRLEHNICKQTTDHTQSRLRSDIRGKFGRPDGYSSCAIVGSAGLLLRSRLGAEIDAHEFVMRTNLAPVGGYEPVVGNRTSVRVMNTEALFCALLERACPELKAGRSAFCPSPGYGVYLNSGREQACRTRHVRQQPQLASSMAYRWPGLGPACPAEMLSC